MSNTLRLAILVVVLLVTTDVFGGEPTAADEVCGKLDPGLEPILSRSDVLLLGETHGSEQIPAYAGQVACAALRLSKPVVLGLELPSTEQKRVDAFVASAGDAAARSRLIAGNFWQRSYQDGRASQAMLALIDTARRLVAEGKPLSVVCFDDPVRKGENRDGAMGRFLVDHRAGHPGSRYVILTGSIHARTTVGTPWNPELRPMGLHLASADPAKVVSLKARSSGGEFWVCNPECGVKQLGGRGQEDARGIQLFEEQDPRGYDGVFDIGAATASLPATRSGD